MTPFSITNLFKEAQQNCIDAADSEFMPLNIACVFSPPAEGNKDVQQIQEDLPQEKEDNKKEPDKKKQALMGIIKEYNEQYGTSHDINNFDGYYQDIQQRIKMTRNIPTQIIRIKTKLTLPLWWICC